MSTFRIIFFFLFFSIVQFSCKRGNIASSGDENFTKFIYAHTNGVVSKSSSVMIQFYEEMVKDSLIGRTVDEKIIKLNPEIEGITIWQDNRTLLFKPSTYLESDKEYKVFVDLQLLFKDLPGSTTGAEFTFRTKAIQFEVIRKELILSPPEFNNFDLTFQVTTSDLVSLSQLESLFVVTSNDKHVPYKAIQDGPNLYALVISNFVPDENDSVIKLSWKEKGQTVEKKFSVPGSTGFNLFDFQIEHDDRMYVSLIFNKILDVNQKTDGLIRLTDQTAGTTIVKERNVLKVYFDKTVYGDKVLKLSADLRSVSGEKLGADKLLNIFFHDFKPALELLGSGYIVPTNNGVIFPFKTMNLVAVDVEIVQIFTNNILQYLQSDNSDYRIDEVGRIIYQNRIDLEKMAGQIPLQNNWETFALDLSELIKIQTNAIYQVRLGFRPGYVKNLECDEIKTVVNDLTLKSGNDEIESFYDNNYYGLSGYHDNYWEERENPCKISFYNNSRFVKRNVLASNIGLMVKRMDNGHYHIFANDLLKAEPLADASISLYDYQQQLIVSGKTNILGEVDLKPQRQPRFVTASFGKDNSFMRIFDGEGLSMTRFDITGISPQKGIKGFFYAEREIWRPGDSVFMNLIVESNEIEISPDFTIDVTVTDPLGRQFLKKTYFNQQINMFSFPFGLPDDALTGNWTIRAKLGGSEFSRTISVETIKPNRFSLEFQVPEIIYKDDRPDLAAKAKWLTGGDASNHLIRIEKRHIAADFYSEKYKDYSFSGVKYNMSETPEIVIEKRLDQRGGLNFNLNMGSLPSGPAVIDMKLNIKVFEEGGNFSNFNRQARYYTYKNYIGINPGKKEYGRYNLKRNEANPIELICIDSRSNPLSGKELNVKIYYKDTYYWWSNQERDLKKYIESYGFNLLLNEKVITDKAGKAKISFTPYDYGTHIVVVEGSNDDHSAYLESYVGYYGGQGEAGKSGSSLIEILNEIKEVETGKEISLRVPADKEGNFLITIENNKGIVERFWQKALQGDNIIKFRANEAMTPNIYINIYHYQPHNNVENDNPIRMYGVVSMRISDPSRKLNPVLQTVKKIEPGSTIDIKVSEKDKKKMAYTLAIVDEGLLSLTNFNTPDPFAYFNAKEALSTTTWDLYDEVLGAYGARISRIFGIGGDRKAEINAEDAEVSRFPPVVKFLGPFFLNAGKTAVHKVEIPNYIGNMRVMVVASDQHAFGKTEENIIVSSELMILSTLPRQLSPKSDFKIPVTIFTDGTQSRNITVKIEDSQKRLKFVKGDTRNLKSKGKGVEIVYFDAQTTSNTGPVKIKVTAQSGNLDISEVVDIFVKNPNPVSRKWTRKIIRPGEQVSLELSSVGSDVRNSSNTIEVSTVVPFSIRSWADELVAYPHGCLEQITSAGIAQLALPSFFTLTPLMEQRVTRNINAVIQKMRNYATAEGGYSYWPSYRDIDAWGTSYAGEFLIEADRRGYNVPSSLIENWKRSQVRLARSWDGAMNEISFLKNQNEMVQAYRLYTLSLAGEPELSSMNKLREMRELGAETKVLLSMAYSLSGNKSVAVGLLENIPEFDQGKYRHSYGLTYGSGIRDIALYMKALVLAGKVRQAEDLILEINLILQQMHWTSTQDKAQLIMAFEKLGTESMSNEQKFLEYKLDNGKVHKADVNKNSFMIEFAMEDYAGQSIEIKNTSQTSMFIDHTMSGKPDVGETSQTRERTGNALLELNTKFFDMNGSVINPSEIAAGQEFYVESTVWNNSRYTYELKELALTVTVPDGWEIINERVNYNQGSDKHRINYVDIRDNKIISYFDLKAGEKMILKNRMIASFEGKFYMAPVVCESMYLRNIYAQTSGKWVAVISK